MAPRWKLSGLVSAILIAVLVIAACAPAAPPTNTPAPKPAAPPPAAAAPPTAAAPAPKPAEPTKPAEAPKPAEPTKPAAAPAAATAAPAAATKPADPAKPAGATPAAGAPASAAKPGAKKLSFIGVQSDQQQRALTAVLREYQKTRPDIDVEFELLPFAQLFPKIQANAASKAPTDIILADGPNVWSFAYNGIISPMDEWFDQEYARRAGRPPRS